MLPVNESDRETLERAIQGERKAQVGYQRADGSISVHVVAPVDIRLGETERTGDTEYLWAFCYAEGIPEMHRCDRILQVRELAEGFSGKALLESWPSKKWPLPNAWVIRRAW